MERSKAQEFERNNQKIQKQSLRSQSEISNDLLVCQDEILSLKIQKKELEQQLEKDIEIKDELNNRQVVYLKNRINDLECNGPIAKASRRVGSSIDAYGSIETCSLSGGAPVHYGSIHYGSISHGKKSDDDKNYDENASPCNIILLNEYHRVISALSKLQSCLKQAHSQD